jgi:hypothetical protein
MGETMKSIIVLLALAAGATSSGMFAQDQPQPPATDKAPATKKKTAKKTAAAPAPQFLTIPKDATPNPDGTYTVTDKDGKKWNYWQSPFGVMRSEVKPAPPMSTFAPGAPAQQDLSYTTTTDKGDTVGFARQTPFGPVQYDKKKSEMTDAEHKLFETQHPESKQTKPE